MNGAITWVDAIDDIDWHELAALYRAAPLADKHPDKLRQAFSNSMFTRFGFENEVLVAAGRVLADGVDVAYLCDVAILPSHQGRGLGRQLVAHLVERARGHDKIFLYAAQGKEGFYTGLGFLRMTTAMAIFADQDGAVARGYLMDGAGPDHP